MCNETEDSKVGLLLVIFFCSDFDILHVVLCTRVKKQENNACD